MRENQQHKSGNQVSCQYTHTQKKNHGRPPREYIAPAYYPNKACICFTQAVPPIPGGGDEGGDDGDDDDDGYDDDVSANADNGHNDCNGGGGGDDDDDNR